MHSLSGRGTPHTMRESVHLYSPVDFRVGNEYRPLGAEIHCDIHQSELRPHSNALIAVCNPSLGIGSEQELI